MVYRPLVSVIALRTRSISAGLDDSTVTPGRTAPVESCTSPEMLACALAVAGNKTAVVPMRTVHTKARCIDRLLSDKRPDSVARVKNGRSTPDPLRYAHWSKTDGRDWQRTIP